VSRRDYLAVADVLALHAVLIERYGGSVGLRDLGALEAALYRPQSGYYDDVVAEGAALFESLIVNHPFVDGNKRVAFAATDVFLRINGFRIRPAPLAIHADLMRMFESGTLDLAHIEPWLRRIVKPAA
jgi:death on curing protein